MEFGIYVLIQIKLIRNSCILLLTLMSIHCFSQKIIEREIDANLINSIEINSNSIHRILIVSEKSNSIKIRTRIEGEHHENVVLSLVEKENILFLKSAYSPFYKAENDKLAAHKVQSIELELIVPESMEISILSTIASVTTKGKFKAISVKLERGNCILKEFIGDANLKTKEGFISVTTSDKILGNAFSKNGKINNELSKNKGSKYLIMAETKEGEISLFQIH
ncbi:MAG: hypothetical protein ACI93P_000237 [bacterium]|jgi:hypothetical protein